MLTAFRKKLASGLVFVILLIGLVAIVVTGFGTDGMGGLGGMTGGGGSTTLVRVGGEQISERELSQIATQEFRAAQEQQPGLTMAQFLGGEGFEQLLGSMVTMAALNQYGQKQGLAVTDAMIDQAILEVPGFRNFAGQFDRQQFLTTIQRMGLSEADVRRDFSRQLMRRQLLAPVASGGRPPEAMVRQYADLMLERRRGAIGVIPVELLSRGVEASQQEIEAYYQANRARFAEPERRVVQYALIGPEQIAQAARATDEDIQAYYRENQATYAARETRTLQHVVLPDQAAASAFVQRVRSGTSFVDAAGQAGFAPTDILLADQSREQFAREANAEIAEAAFGAQQGGVVGPIRSEFGFHMVRVERVAATPARSLEAVRGEIAQAVEQRKREDALNSLLERIDALINEGRNMAEIGRETGLSLTATPPITAAGAAQQEGWQPPAELAALIGPAFQIDADAPEPSVEQLPGEERFAVVGVERVIAAATPPLAQIADRVRDAVIAQKAMQRAEQIARTIAQRINAGMPAARAFAEAGINGLPAPQSVNLQRIELLSAGPQAPPPLSVLFAIPERSAQPLAAPNSRGWFVIHHEQRTPGSAEGNEQLLSQRRMEFGQTFGQELAWQFGRAVEGRARVRRDEDAIARARRTIVGR